MHDEARYEHLGSTDIATGGFLRLSADRFAGPTGNELVRYTVHHPGAVVAVPLIDSDDGPAALCVRQFRSAARRRLLELPAGKLDVPGEDPDAAVVRELIEEIGQRPAKLEKLATFWNSPGFCTELTHCYLASGLTPCDPDEAVELKEEEQDMTIEVVPLAHAVRMVADGGITDAKTIIGLLLASAHLGERGCERRSQAGPGGFGGRGPADG